MRPIDADLLKDSLRSLEARGTNINYVKGLQNAIDEYFPQIIDNAPTVEAEPVKHARWEQCCNLMGEYFKCSECGYKAEVPTCMGEPIYIFCPNCGAKMDGGADNGS
jgi:hypothetical protein